MSYGYLLASNGSVDDLKKSRYMKFEKLSTLKNLHFYTRMEYAGQDCYLIELDVDKNFCLSKYGVSFFEGIKCDEIYFTYFLLTKRVQLESIMNNSAKIIHEKTKVFPLLLRDRERPTIELYKIYRLSTEKIIHHGGTKQRK